MDFHMDDFLDTLLWENLNGGFVYSKLPKDHWDAMVWMANDQPHQILRWVNHSTPQASSLNFEGSSPKRPYMVSS